LKKLAIAISNHRCLFVGDLANVARILINLVIEELQCFTHGTNLFTYLPLFNITTLIKSMNKKEEEAPLEDPCVRRNRLAREKHTA
jgi:hypothetical protein